jgi:HAD superfamily hydrolase (TIGR01459 family)
VPENARGSRFLRFAAEFPTLFLDQYGVLHDGAAPYPGAIDALQALKSTGAQVVILSNSGRSGDHNARRMERLGFGRDLYDHFVTSGDVAKSLLLGGDLPVAVRATTRCLSLSTSGAHDLADELGFTSVDDAASADLLLISGSQADRIAMEDYAALMAPAAARGVLCLCTNPDKLMLQPGGVRPGAGAIASLYETLGGAVIWIGKPYPEIYRHAQTLVRSPDASNILCVGDSIEHDIVGARSFGATAALVRTGILARLNEAELARECAAQGVLPDVILPGLT